MNKNLNIYQQKVIKDNSKYLLVSAPAGSGKTFTILEKINYLVKEKNIKEDEILCISFTNEAVNSIKDKLKNDYALNILCYTFHKLGLEILKKYNYKICEYNLLNYVINEYLYYLINNDNRKRLLSYYKIKYNNKNYIKKYKLLNKEHLKSLIEKFINLFKANDFNDNDFISYIKTEKNKRYKNLLIVIFYIYKTYTLELLSKKEIDFNDMISLATIKVKEKGFNKNIKYIIIDEFQDTSKIRFNLIKEILNKTNSSLLVVGDDYQSIYRFTGCDLSLFLNFKSMFKNANIITLKKTYRNSKQLINIASKFIIKNKNQIKKETYSDKSIKKPIEIIKYINISKTFIKLINKIHKETKKEILVLGRNNFDINMLKNNKLKFDKDIIIYKGDPNIKIRYLTVHKAKGLEAENVIIINLTNNILGFPNKIEDNHILKYVTCKIDNYSYSEERRLFYVALTRTKNKVYLLCPYFNESIFIKEIKKIVRKV